MFISWTAFKMAKRHYQLTHLACLSTVQQAIIISDELIDWPIHIVLGRLCGVADYRVITNLLCCHSLYKSWMWVAFYYVLRKRYVSYSLKSLCQRSSLLRYRFFTWQMQLQGNIICDAWIPLTGKLIDVSKKCCEASHPISGTHHAPSSIYIAYFLLFTTVQRPIVLVRQAIQPTSFFEESERWALKYISRCLSKKAQTLLLLLELMPR